MQVGQPGLRGGHETIRHERTPVAREVADNRRLPGIVPRQRKRTLWELLAVRNVKGRRERRHLAELIWSQSLRDFDDPGLTALEIGDRDRAVACAEVDAKAETSIHGVEPGYAVPIDFPQRRRTA